MDILQLIGELFPLFDRNFFLELTILLQLRESLFL